MLVRSSIGKGLSEERKWSFTKQQQYQQQFQQQQYMYSAVCTLSTSQRFLHFVDSIILLVGSGLAFKKQIN